MFAGEFVACYCIFTTYFAVCVDKFILFCIINMENAETNCKYNTKSGEKLCKEILLWI